MSRAPKWVLRVLGAAAMLAVVAGLARGQEFDADAGADDDAGVSVVTAVSPSEPVVTLPPAIPSPQIAPLVDDASEARSPALPTISSAERPTFLIKTVLGLLSLLTLAYVGGQPRVIALERRLGISEVITAGFPFVLLGWFARVPAVGLLNDELLSELSPLLRVGLGCIGFVAGFRFSAQLSFAPQIVRLGSFVTAVPFALVTLLSGLVLLWLSGDVSSAAASDPVFLRDALILGTAGAMTAITRTGNLRNPDSDKVLGRILRFEELAGIIALAVIAAYFRPRIDATWQLPGTAWLLLTLGLGATLGLIAFLILNRPQEGPEFALLTLGLIGFCAGTAGYLRLSPIVIAFIAGAFLALLPAIARQRLHQALRRLERPIYLLSLIVVGALWQIDDWRGWVLVPVFTSARMLGKRLGVDFGLRFSGLPLTAEQTQALAVAPIGPLAIAIVVNAQLLYPGGSISPIVAAVIVGGVLTEIIVQLASRRASKDAEAASRGSA